MKWKHLVYSAAAMATATSLLLCLKSRAVPAGLQQVQIINLKSYVQISTEMREYFKERYVRSQRKLREYRRSLISRSAEYEQAIKDFNKKVRLLVAEAQEQVLKKFRLTKKQFEDSVNYYDSDLNVRNLAEKIYDVGMPVQEKEILEPEQTKAVIDFYKERLEEYESDCPELDEYMIINAQIHDEIFRKFKVEIEVVDASWERYREEFGNMYEGLRSQTFYVLASTENSI